MVTAWPASRPGLTNAERRTGRADAATADTLAGVTVGDVTVTTAPRYTPGSPRTKSLWMNEIRPK